MKILFSPCHYIYDDFYGGSEYSWAFNIADRIATNNINSVIITGAKRISYEKKYQIIEVQQDKINLEMNFRNAILFSYRYFRATGQQLRKSNFDIIHHILPFSINNTFNLSIIFRKNKIPAVIGPVQSPLAFLDSDRQEPNKLLQASLLNLIYFLIKPLINFLSGLTLRAASQVVVINEYTKELLAQQGINKDKIAVLPPGIDTKKYKYIPQLDKKNSKIELLVICHLVARKAVDLIIQAVGEVVREDKGILLRIVGDGPQKNNLQELVRSLKLEQYVIFEGFVKNCDIQQYYEKSQIFLNMSRAEGFATICLEAMSSGLAIISSRVGGFADAIRDGENGFLVEPENYLELANKIIILLKNHELMEVFGKNARIDAERYYDWDKVIIPKYLAIYHEVIKK